MFLLTSLREESFLRLTARIAGVAGLVLTAAALLAGTASADGLGHAGAVFVQTDDPAGNTIVAYDRDRDGSLRQAGSYATGGFGGVLAGSVVDHVASQGSLAVDRRAGLLYAVNPGSDTITVFAIHGDQLFSRQILSSGGSFPVSLAVRDHVVYVLNARDGGSLQGYLRAGNRLLPVARWHRDLGLDATATPEFTHTPGQVTFTPGGRRLLVTTKANGNAVDVFRVYGLGGLSPAPVVNTLPEAVPFAAVFDAGGHVVLAEAGPNAVQTLTLTPDGALHGLTEASTGQSATCWIVRAGDRFYASNAGSGTLSGYRDDGHGSLAALGNTPTHPGTVDAAVSPDGRVLYVQTGATGTVDEFNIHGDGSLTAIGSVAVPGAAGGEGIATT
jgi:DNA-binding beta-propeller fold protein YncE